MAYDEEKELRRASELLATADLLEQLQSIDLDKIHRDGMTDMEKMVEDLRNSKSVKRKLAKPKAQPYQPNPKMSWRQRRKKRKNYYQSVAKYRRLELKGELLSAGSEGWWKYINRTWQQHKVPVELTFEEWNEHIWPSLAEKDADGTAKPGTERIPIIRRYQPNKPISLGNVWVTESGNEKNVLFDGKEHLLRAKGYIL